MKTMGRDDKLTFGKHKGWSIAQVLAKDWGYILWLHENDVVELPEDVVSEAYTEDANSSPPEDFFWQPG